MGSKGCPQKSDDFKKDVLKKEDYVTKVVLKKRTSLKKLS